MGYYEYGGRGAQIGNLSETAAERQSLAVEACSHKTSPKGAGVGLA